MKKRILFSFIVLSGLISSCNSSLGVPFAPYSTFVNDNDSYQKEEFNGYYKPASFEPVNYENDSGAQESFSSFQEVFRSQNKTINMPSVGKRKLLVIPVEFQDYSITDFNISKTDSINNIQNAFFGEKNNCQWESVASYYNKSSYGKLTIEGKVSSWFKSSFYVNEIKDYTGKRADTLKSINTEALLWYKENYDDFSDFDTDQDGVLDAVYYVFAYPSETDSINSNKMFWAYMIYNPYPICWSSYSLTYLSNGLPDSHTYIHEMGHALGLKDYYNIDGGISNPTGKVDMMDYSIGDHTSYSKMLLNWTRPYVVTSSTTISLNAFEISGETILIKNNWNKSAMDEYLLIEMYSPINMNARDSKPNSSQISLMSKPGIKIYHVDSRVGFVSKTNQETKYGYVYDTKLSKNDYRLAILNDNGNSYKSNSLYHLLESSGENSFIKGDSATNATLFVEGSDFGINKFKGFKFHDGSELGYTISIQKITNTFATLSISKTI